MTSNTLKVNWFWRKLISERVLEVMRSNSWVL